MSEIWHAGQTAPNVDGWQSEEPLDGEAGLIIPARYADGRLVLFFAGVNTGLYYNDQMSPGGLWNSALEIPSDGVKEIAVGMNADGRLGTVLHGVERWALRI